MKLRIRTFISHAGEDKQLTLPLHQILAHNLSDLGLSQKLLPFFDMLTMPAESSESADNIIYEAIDHCGIFVFVASPNSINKPWPLRELARAIERKKQDPHLVILPVYYDISVEDVRAVAKASLESDKLDEVSRLQSNLENLHDYSGITCMRKGLGRINNDDLIGQIVDVVVTQTTRLHPFLKIEVGKLINDHKPSVGHEALHKKIIAKIKTR